MLLSGIDLDPEEPAELSAGGRGHAGPGQAGSGVGVLQAGRGPRAERGRPVCPGPGLPGLGQGRGQRRRPMGGRQPDAPRLGGRPRPATRPRPKWRWPTPSSGCATAGRTADADKMQSAMEAREAARPCRRGGLGRLGRPRPGSRRSRPARSARPAQPQSTGGGLWRGDQLMDASLADKYRETYTAAEAFPGSYEIRVKKVWGQPLGDKVTVRVTRHQGTAGPDAGTAPADPRIGRRGLAQGHDRGRTADRLGLGPAAGRHGKRRRSPADRPGSGLQPAAGDVRPDLFRHDQAGHDGRLVRGRLLGHADA